MTKGYKLSGDHGFWGFKSSQWFSHGFLPSLGSLTRSRRERTKTRCAKRVKCPRRTSRKGQRTCFDTEMNYINDVYWEVTWISMMLNNGNLLSTWYQVELICCLTCSVNSKTHLRKKIKPCAMALSRNLGTKWSLPGDVLIILGTSTSQHSASKRFEPHEENSSNDWLYTHSTAIA